LEKSIPQEARQFLVELTSKPVDKLLMIDSPFINDATIKDR